MISYHYIGTVGFVVVSYMIVRGKRKQGRDEPPSSALNINENTLATTIFSVVAINVVFVRVLCPLLSVARIVHLILTMLPLAHTHS